jgi:hypothetical protein
MVLSQVIVGQVPQEYVPRLRSPGILPGDLPAAAPAARRRTPRDEVMQLASSLGKLTEIIISTRDYVPIDGPAVSSVMDSGSRYGAGARRIGLDGDTKTYMDRLIPRLEALSAQADQMAQNYSPRLFSDPNFQESFSKFGLQLLNLSYAMDGYEAIVGQSYLYGTKQVTRDARTGLPIHEFAALPDGQGQQIMVTPFIANQIDRLSYYTRRLGFRGVVKFDPALNLPNPNTPIALFNDFSGWLAQVSPETRELWGPAKYPDQLDSSTALAVRFLIKPPPNPNQQIDPNLARLDQQMFAQLVQRAAQNPVMQTWPEELSRTRENPKMDVGLIYVIQKQLGVIQDLMWQALDAEDAIQAYASVDTSRYVPDNSRLVIDNREVPIPSDFTPFEITIRYRRGQPTGEVAGRPHYNVDPGYDEGYQPIAGPHVAGLASPQSAPRAPGKTIPLATPQEFMEGTVLTAPRKNPPLPSTQNPPPPSGEDAPPPPPAAADNGEVPPPAVIPAAEPAPRVTVPTPPVTGGSGNY